MNVKQLIEKYKSYEGKWNAPGAELARQIFIEDLKLLDETETGHADEAPRYVKNILARLRELPLHDREDWLKAIMGEFTQDFSSAKWREGYEQGKVEGAWVGNQLKEADKIRQELNKPVVPQFVADWYEERKNNIDFEIWCYLHTFSSQKEDEFKKWMNKVGLKQIQTLVNMHQFGYEVEKEKEFLVKIKANNQYLMNNPDENAIFFYSSRAYASLTRKELEEAGFGWVFDCPGIEIEEVTE